MNHPDFRVGGKIFATLGYPDETWAMVSLPPVDQDLFIQADPEGFVPVKGAWGKQGATNVRLGKAKKALVKRALESALSDREERQGRQGRQGRYRPARRPPTSAAGVIRSSADSCDHFAPLAPTSDPVAATAMIAETTAA